MHYSSLIPAKIIWSSKSLVHSLGLIASTTKLTMCPENTKSTIQTVFYQPNWLECKERLTLFSFSLDKVGPRLFSYREIFS